jgi:hypothetical protein
MTLVELLVISVASVIGLACTVVGLLWEYRDRISRRRRRR